MSTSYYLVCSECGEQSYNISRGGADSFIQAHLYHADSFGSYSEHETGIPRKCSWEKITGGFRSSHDKKMYLSFLPDYCPQCGQLTKEYEVKYEFDNFLNDKELAEDKQGLLTILKEAK